MLIGLRLYKKLISLEKLLSMSVVEESPPPIPPKPAESILSWRQWWSSPRSQSSKLVSSSPTKEGKKEDVLPPKTSKENPITQLSPSKEPAIQRALSSPDLGDVVPVVNYSKSLRLPSEDLKKLGLHYGMNTISFSVITSKNGKATSTARIFLWRSDEKIVISDIDGTITKSDALGHLFQFVGKDWTHLGVAQLYTDIAKNGYRFLYLTSRPIGQANSTRGYLRGIEQDRYQLPEGPVIMSPDRFFMAMRREVIEGNPEQFKIPCLLDIRRLFYARPAPTEYNPMEMTESEKNSPSPFYAGFGNRHTDALSYQAVGINPGRIYIINPSGDLSLQIITGYRSSYVKLVDLVDKVFPPLNQAIERDRQAKSLTAENLVDASPLADLLKPVEASNTAAVDQEEFNDFFFWRQTMLNMQQQEASTLMSSQASDNATANGSSADLRPEESTTALTASGMNRVDEDETSSERGDQYYFEENEEAGLIPFA